MRACVYLALAALTAAAASAAPSARTQAPEPAATNSVPVKIVYPGGPAGGMQAEDWAEELAEKAEQGLHIANGNIFVLARVPAADGECRALAKVRAKFRAVEFLRIHYPGLPESFSAPCRVLLCETRGQGSECVAVVAFSAADIASCVRCGGGRSGRSRQK